MEKQTTKTQDSITAAKELIAAEEKKQGDAAVAILKKAIEEIDKMGFSVVPCGSFVGNQMNASIQVLKKKT